MIARWPALDECRQRRRRRLAAVIVSPRRRPSADVIQRIVDRVCSRLFMQKLAALAAADADDTSASSWLANTLAEHMASRVAESQLAYASGKTLTSAGIAICPGSRILHHDDTASTTASCRLWHALLQTRTLSACGAVPPVLMLPRPLAWLAVSNLRILVLDGMSGLHAMPPGLRQLRHLCALTCSRCDIAAWPADTIEVLPDLHTVDFHGNGMRGRVSGLRMLRRLEYVDLSHNKLTMPAAGQWVLPDPPPHLYYLNVARAFAESGSRARRMHAALFTKTDAIARNLIYITE